MSPALESYLDCIKRVSFKIVVNCALLKSKLLRTVRPLAILPQEASKEKSSYVSIFQN